MNINEYKLDVDFDKEKGLLYATLSVPSVPRSHGIKMYVLEDVLGMLKKQGFELAPEDCVGRTAPSVRTNRPTSTKATWTFNLVKKKAVSAPTTENTKTTQKTGTKTTQKTGTKKAKKTASTKGTK